MRPSRSVALVTGASGSLGWVLASRLAATAETIAAYHSHAVRPEGTRGIKLNLEDPRGIRGILDECRPGTIFHLAAITDPDRCERRPELALRINLTATGELAEWAGAAGAKMVFASTDLVFDGSKGNYSEVDEPAPLGVYGKTKLDAEKVVLAACPDAVVIRTSLLYGLDGPVGRTFLSGVLKSLGRGRSMRLFEDQKRNPVLLEDLAGAMIDAVDIGLEGLFHVGGAEVVTRYEFGETVCEVFGFDKRLLVPIKMADFEYAAPRPLDSSLDIAKIKEASGFNPTPLARALADVKRRLQ